MSSKGRLLIVIILDLHVLEILFYILVITNRFVAI